MADQIKLRSKIPHELLKEHLVRGSALAAMGASLLLYASIRFPEETLAVWGPWFFGVGIALIAWGMIPYRRMQALQTQPDELIIEPERFHLKSKGRLLFSVPLSAIEAVDFMSGSKPGIGITLKEKPEEKIQVHCNRFCMLAFQRKSKKRHGVPLFMPYFNEHACRELQECIEAEE